MKQTLTASPVAFPFASEGHVRPFSSRSVRIAAAG